MNPERQIKLLDEYLHGEVRPLLEAQMAAIRAEIAARLEHRADYPTLCHLQGQIAGINAALKAPALAMQAARRKSGSEDG